MVTSACRRETTSRTRPHFAHPELEFRCYSYDVDGQEAQYLTLSEPIELVPGPSVFNPRSLFEDEEGMEMPDVQADDVSTIPSLLTTPSQADRSLPPPSPHEPPTATPDQSFSLCRYLKSSLRTQTSESTATERDLPRDINRIAGDLRPSDVARGNENRELAESVRALRNELRNLSDYLHRSPHPRAPEPEFVDEGVGRSTTRISYLDVPARGRSAAGLSRASSIVSSVPSYLSSQYSDDDILASPSYRNAPSYLDSPTPWPAPTISGESSSVFSDETPRSQVTGSAAATRFAYFLITCTCCRFTIPELSSAIIIFVLFIFHASGTAANDYST
ncbi:hypothetical protein H0H93_007787 [Arthromyces matolae]|nr:hypothetical protein H0H93_007787 [Arthromyces matolae]